MDNKVLRKRTVFVIIVTFLTMIAEIYFGIITHSMALTADGFHMGTHVVAFSITLIICLIAAKLKERTKKLDALGGYTSAILLGFSALAIIWESVERFFNPKIITFEDAILVAVIGLVANLICMVILGKKNELHRHHGCEHECHHHEHCENLNYMAAYFHILADIMTSVLAIGALILGKYFGLAFLDPIIGVLGGLIIAKWAYNLLSSSSKILLDFE